MDEELQDQVDKNNQKVLENSVDPEVREKRKSDKILVRLAALENGHSTLSRQIEINTAVTQSIKADTKELIALFKTFKTLFKFLGYLVPVSKFILTVGATLLFIWLLYKGKPEIPGITFGPG